MSLYNKNFDQKMKIFSGISGLGLGWACSSLNIKPKVFIGIALTTSIGYTMLYRKYCPHHFPIGINYCDYCGKNKY